jgi:hypothetical protein
VKGLFAIALMIAVAAAAFAHHGTKVILADRSTLSGGAEISVPADAPSATP